MGEPIRTYNVIISDRAADMLIEHVRFLARTSLRAAEELRKGITASATSLKSFPERNPRLSDPALPSDKYYKMITNKRYLLIYQIKNETIFIEYIVDCRCNYTWLL